MEAKKILFIAPRFHTNQFFLIKKLLEKDIQVSFFTVYSGASENYKFITPIKSKPSILSKPFLRNLQIKKGVDRNRIAKLHFTSIRQCIELYRKNQYDILIIRNLHSLISLQHFFLGLVLNKKIFIYSQNPYRDKVGYKRKILLRFLKILSVSHFTPVYGNPDNPIIPNTSYLPFVIEPQIGRDEILNRKKGDCIKIVTIGKLVARKNLIELVECLNNSQKVKSSNIQLTIISEATSEENSEYLQKLKDKLHKVNFKYCIKINIHHEKVISILKSSDLFVLPSNREPAAFSLLEAMACGLAVVSSDQNGTRCYIEEMINGHIFEYSEDLGKLKILFDQILRKDLLMRYGFESLRIVSQNHNISKFYKTVIE